MYTSRTAIECYNSVCKAKRYVNYLYNNGIGLAANNYDVALTFGSAIHKGIELLLKGYTFELALENAKEVLVQCYETNTYTDRKTTNLEYSFNEHLALCEGLLYGYYLTEYEFIANNYNIIAVEQEFETILAHSEKFNEDIILLSKVDAILQHKETGDIHTYHIKTEKETGYISQDTHSNDLQGLTEIWSTEQWGQKLIPYKQEILNTMVKFADEKAINTVKSYLDKKYPTFDKVSAIRFCQLIKGKRWEYEDGNVHTLNPLIYGYRKPFIDNGKVSGYAYAFSYSYTNQANRSGTGKLGKGWDKFPVWSDYPGGVIQWIDDISEGLIQPDEPNPIPNLILVPEPYYRDEAEVLEAIDAIAYQELKVLEDSKNTLLPVSTLFPKNRKSCNYPVVCEFKDYCYRPSIQKDPIESGLYRYRKSHHAKELEWQQSYLQESTN